MLDIFNSCGDNRCVNAWRHLIHEPSQVCAFLPRKGVTVKVICRQQGKRKTSEGFLHSATALDAIVSEPESAASKNRPTHLHPVARRANCVRGIAIVTATSGETVPS
jgi:hypothetical protein